MRKPKTKYQPDHVFSVDKDGFFGMYFEPEVNRFPGEHLAEYSAWLSEAARGDNMI